MCDGRGKIKIDVQEGLTTLKRLKVNGSEEIF